MRRTTRSPPIPRKVAPVGRRTKRPPARPGGARPGRRASHLGPGRRGKKTANGERFDPSKMTAIHRCVEVRHVARGDAPRQRGRASASGARPSSWTDRTARRSPSSSSSLQPRPAGWLARSSWYGPGFEGKKTANGERFDPSKMTAAHRTRTLCPLSRRVTSSHVPNFNVRCAAVILDGSNRSPFAVFFPSKPGPYQMASPSSWSSAPRPLALIEVRHVARGDAPRQRAERPRPRDRSWAVRRHQPHHRSVAAERPTKLGIRKMGVANVKLAGGRRPVTTSPL